MSFNLINASVTFQSYINKTLREHLNVICVVYLNDIVIYSRDEDKHEKHVREILKCLAKTDLHARLKKCNFSVRKVHFLRYVMTLERMIMKRTRVKIILS